MHKLIDYVCDELEELERKAEKDGKLSMAEVQYADTLAHMKKNLLKSEEMSEDMEYSMADGRTRRGEMSMRGGNGYRYDGRGSYARGRKRDSMGRYSREGYSMGGGDMIEELHELMKDAPDERTRMEFQRFIDRMEQM